MLEPSVERIETSLKRERRFVDDAAHEFRTPLSIIKAQCQTIEPDRLDADTRQRLKNIVEGVDRMTALSGQLLDQVRAEQSQATPQAVQVAAVLRDVVAEMTPDAKRREVAIEVNQTASPIIDGRAEDLHRMLRNILENAIKFSGTPGQVQIKLDETCLTVEDNGPGIPEPLREQISDRFFQVDKAAVSSARGAGLGLSIVQTIADRNGLIVKAEDSTSLPGACFRLAWRAAEPASTKCA